MFPLRMIWQCYGGRQHPKTLSWPKRRYGCQVQRLSCWVSNASPSDGSHTRTPGGTELVVSFHAHFRVPLSTTQSSAQFPGAPVPCPQFPVPSSLSPVCCPHPLPCPKFPVPSLLPPVPCPQFPAPSLLPPVPCPPVPCPSSLPLPCLQFAAPSSLPKFPVPVPCSHLSSLLPPVPCPKFPVPSLLPPVPCPPVPCPQFPVPSSLSPFCCPHDLRLYIQWLEISLV